MIKTVDTNAGEKLIPREESEILLDDNIIKSLENKHKNRRDRNETTNEELTRYFDYLELRSELLQDKTALDLGSNDSVFDEYCQKKYNTNFIALDNEPSRLGTKHELGVIADARILPFKDDSFDLIISIGSMPQILVRFSASEIIEGKIYKEAKEKYIQDLLKLFRETYRTLKQKGQIRMATLSEKSTEIRLSKIKNHDPDDINRYRTTRLNELSLITESLEIFEKESGAKCIFKDEEKGGLIIIVK